MTVAHVRERVSIKTSRIISAIKEVGETLALTNQPEPLVDSVLETISGIFSPDYCWIQLFDEKTGRLSLVAYRGLDTPIPYELDSIDAGHPVYNTVIGAGDSIIIPELSKDGQYLLDIFQQEGYTSLIAVPMLTYHVHGILGLAYRKKRKFTKAYTELVTVIAGLIDMALNKLRLESANGDNGSKKDREPEPQSEPVPEPVTDSRTSEEESVSKARPIAFVPGEALSQPDAVIPTPEEEVPDQPDSVSPAPEEEPLAQPDSANLPPEEETVNQANPVTVNPGVQSLNRPGPETRITENDEPDPSPEQPAVVRVAEAKTASNPSPVPTKPEKSPPIGAMSDPFQEHIRKMKSFRRSHG